VDFVLQAHSDVQKFSKLVLPFDYFGINNITVVIQINHQPDATISPVYYPDIYLQLNMFWASSRPSSGAQQLQ
jgi:hypothetical protein